MRKLLGHMVTWTTYGAWLQGDRRGYVKDGEVLGCNERLEESNKDSQANGAVTLNSEERKIVREAVEKEAESHNVKLHALAVCSNHVHIVVEASSESIGQIVHRYKRLSTFALRKAGLGGKVWTRGYDKRYCFDEVGLNSRIEYVNKHKV